MTFLISLIVVAVFILACHKVLRKHPLPFYIGTVIIALAVIICTFAGVRFPAWFTSYVWPLFAQSGLSGAMFVAVMYAGALPNSTKAVKTLLPIRGELSIMASILTLAHNISYGRTYFVRFLDLPWYQMIAAVCSMVMILIMLPLFITSFKPVRKKMKAKSWKKLQRLAYGFYGLMYAHIMFLMVPLALRGRSGYLFSIALYTIVFVGYAILRIEKAVAVKQKATSVLPRMQQFSMAGSICIALALVLALNITVNNAAAESDAALAVETFTAEETETAGEGDETAEDEAADADETEEADAEEEEEVPEKTEETDAVEEEESVDAETEDEPETDAGAEETETDEKSEEESAETGESAESEAGEESETETVTEEVAEETAAVAAEAASAETTESATEANTTADVEAQAAAEAAEAAETEAAAQAEAEAQAAAEAAAAAEAEAAAQAEAEAAAQAEAEAAAAAEAEAAAQAEAEAAAQAEAEAAAAAEAAKTYKDGTYSGTAFGYVDNVSVSVTIQDDVITSITITYYGDDDLYYSDATSVISRILSAQSTNVDTVSGATYTSQAIINAVKSALASAKN